MLHDLALPVRLTTRSGELTLRNAVDEDLDALMALLSDDPISAARGDVAAPEDRPQYAESLRSIVDDPANALLVAEDADGRLVGTLQLTRIPGMARRGATRLLVEAVRVSSALRSGGIGSALMRWVTDVAAPALGTPLVQLTSDAARTDAHRFYERLGFTGSHVGFKYRVPDPSAR
ncbi:GNAT family N-acetyltransferase [Curtobacterium flaccumfaciens pv. flaccumfaciens]|uniref:GNAT family N-acetyltransferase n=1 Tax=Curtobacterium flaccumfaciens TaxID=2035 RepID=UPI00217DBD4E|nr:GNAT family N-acetyltransferase [Curtobacterium flaccumfaciens]MCS6567890.1 GNAT family N-acetyltransferase [Curtobacterium flaccumfaciens pv. flaccumfaciens]MCS6583992.1 GNAT family N-acetyltransferase [Curtobacterium flaccumfaciens pv. flaccumfaciens]